MGKRVLFLPLISALAGICSLNAQADCKPGDPTGYFQGTAHSMQAGTLAAALNLRCADGEYEGELTTPVGIFAVKDGSFESGKLSLQLEQHGNTVRVEAALEGVMLQGSFRAGDDAGPFEVRRTGEARMPGFEAPTLQLTKEQWLEDLKFLASELEEKHGNAFHYVSREKFKSEVAALERQLDHLDGDGVYVGLDRLANMIGDGHTYVMLPPDSADFPIDFRWIGGEYRVVAVAPGNEKALGSRVVKIQDTPIARARELLRQVTPADETVSLADHRIEDFLSTGILLHGLGVIADRNVARYTLADASGRNSTLEIRAMPMEQRMKVEWIDAAKQRPLYRQRPGESFWYSYLPESKTVYCNFRGYDDLEKNAEGLFKKISEEKPDKLVIDLRQNGGGDYKKGQEYLIEPIRRLASINKKGHLFVIVGPYTFSAAMSNASHFRYQTAAILVGEPIGEKPNSYQEARQSNLPNSHLMLHYSTQFYKFVESGENLIRPDHEIVPSWKDYKEGRDPVLQWILKYHPGSKPANRPR